MTANVIRVLDKISNNEIFQDELYFIGGTALSYYLNHRVSEDIDIIAPFPLDYKAIIPQMTLLGAVKLQDEHETALKMAGLFPDEYMLKFILDDVKIEFFQANRPIQKEVLSEASFESFKSTSLKILDLKSIVKLKLIALIIRNKLRDLFDFGSVLENNILSKDELVDLFSRVDSKIATVENIVSFIKLKKETKDDEAVYLSESDRVDFNFEEIQEQVIVSLLAYKT
jgi:predicted nucleotidyltransferase component of viral defense system